MLEVGLYNIWKITNPSRSDLEFRKIPPERNKMWKNNWSKKREVGLVVLVQAKIKNAYLLLEVLAKRLGKKKKEKATKLENRSKIICFQII